MESKERGLDEVLGAGQKDGEVSIWDDAGAEELVLGEDIADIMILATPGVEGFGGSIAASRRSGGTVWGGHVGDGSQMRYRWGETEQDMMVQQLC